ncbi:ornithine decarboxylase SPE1 [Sporobolomyces koalae]|uniref:ornithine decarboxylase SPE1 n=1 Tax=Sporobolomyces koalae TaxID=500713 RepID=UPI00317A012F
MTAIAIPAASQPFNPNQDSETSSFFPISCSPLSRSPFAHQLSLSPSAAAAKFPVNAAKPHRKSFGSHTQPRPTPANRPLASTVQAELLPPVFSGSIMHNFKTALAEIDLDHCDAHGENAFFVADLAEVYRQHMRWMRELGERVTPFFAVKSNPDPYVLRLMAALGLGFDCASQPEIAAVLNLPGNVSPSRIIYANPCKAASFIRHAARNNVDCMTFDNGDELVKIKKHYPDAKMVLRILTDDSSSLCRLGLKFGAPLSEVRGLLRQARKLGVNVVGISFHCGSGCKDPSLFGDAIRRARWAFDVGKEEGFDFNLLDIGGGFEDDNFEQIAAVLRDAISLHFPVEEGIKIIAEPGRYYVCRAFELATNIIAKRSAREGTNDEESMMEGINEADDEDTKPTVMYYINDGVYSSFNSIMFDHQIVHPHVLTLSDEFQATAVTPATPVDSAVFEECSVWGPTCDSIDCVQPKAVLPTNLVQVGDWLRWDQMGAYTICAASQFNGFRRSTVRYTIDAKGDSALEAKIRALLA